MNFLKITSLILVSTILIHCSAKKKTALYIPKVSYKENSLYYFMLSEIESMEDNQVASAYFLDLAVEKDSKSPYLKIQKAYELARQNKFDEALELAYEIEKEKPQDPEVLLLLGKLYAALKKNSQAIKYLNLAIKHDPYQEEAYHLLARQYLLTDQTEKSMQLMRRLVEVNPESSQAYFFLGSLYANKYKNYPKAISAFKNILAINPGDIRILRLIADIKIEQKKLTEAISYLEKIFEINPNNSDPLIEVAMLYYEMKRIDDAIKTFNQILFFNPNSPRILYFLGLLHADKNEWEKALDYLAKVSPQTRYYEDSVIRQVSYYQTQKEFDTAIKVATTATRKSPKNPKLWDLLASIHIANENPDQAINSIKQGLKSIPGHEELYFTLGVIYDRIGNTEKSIDAMEKVIEVNPDNALALNFIGYTYANQGIKLEYAKELIKKALQLKPDDGYIVDSLAWVYFKEENYPKALELLKKANELSPNEPAILEHLGDWYLSQNNKKQAKKYFQKSLSISNKKEKKSYRLKELIQRIEEKINQL
jgi:tetratricopeptide (TPR) repeat protein